MTEYVLSSFIPTTIVQTLGHDNYMQNIFLFSTYGSWVASWENSLQFKSDINSLIRRNVKKI